MYGYWALLKNFTEIISFNTPGSPIGRKHPHCADEEIGSQRSHIPGHGPQFSGRPSGIQSLISLFSIAHLLTTEHTAVFPTTPARTQKAQSSKGGAWPGALQSGQRTHVHWRLAEDLEAPREARAHAQPALA